MMEDGSLKEEARKVKIFMVASLKPLSKQEKLIVNITSNDTKNRTVKVT